MKLRKLAVAASLAAIGLSAALTTPAFAAEEQFFPVLASRAKRRNGDFALPNACRLIVLLVLVVLIQVATGQIQFFGDALVLVLKAAT